MRIESNGYSVVAAELDFSAPAVYIRLKAVDLKLF